jgi:arabinofuranan 3-O-arabinosyltransferase
MLNVARDRWAPTGFLQNFTYRSSVIAAEACGYSLAITYAVLLFYFYRAGVWLVDSDGRPTLNDFTAFWIAGTQALHGEVGSVYDPDRFQAIQAGLVGPVHPPLYPNCPYPPTFFLILAPLATLPYLTAFFTWQVVTLLALLTVVFVTVRRRAIIAAVLASPLTAWNFFEGQSGFLTAALVGAALLALERWPIFAGVLIGCLTFKPQLGVFFPVALIAARQWRIFATATATAATLAAGSILAFGIGPWEALPREVLIRMRDYLLSDNPWAVTWMYFQTIYGLVRALHGTAALAWLAQSCATTAVAVIVWLVWRFPVRYPLKAAILSAVLLIGTPYGFAYDMTGIVIPLAFLVRDQMRFGVLRGELIFLIGLYGAAFCILLSLGFSPVGPIMIIVLVGVILRRILRVPLPGSRWIESGRSVAPGPTRVSRISVTN